MSEICIQPTMDFGGTGTLTDETVVEIATNMTTIFAASVNAMMKLTADPSPGPYPVPPGVILILGPKNFIPTPGPLPRVRYLKPLSAIG